MSLADFDGTTPPSSLEFEKVAFWVCMFNLPLACISREMGKRIEASIGTVEEVDVDDDGVGWGEYLRVRIILDLSKPLSRGHFLKVKDKSIWISFQYKKIPMFCFKCGIIRHGGKGCQRPRGRWLQENESDIQFGPWLRVPSTGNRNGRGRGIGLGKHNRAQWGNSSTSNSFHTDLHKKNKAEQGIDEGSGEKGIREDFTGTPTVPVRVQNGKYDFAKGSNFSKKDNENHGRLNRKEGEDFIAGENGEEIRGGNNDSIGSLIVGDERIFISTMEDMAHRSLNEKILANKGKAFMLGNGIQLRRKWCGKL